MRGKSHIGVRVRAARRHRGLSREELAVRSGISWSAIAQVEAGRRTNLRPSTLDALARALGVTVDYLMSSAASDPMLEHHAMLYDNEADLLATVVPQLAAAVERSEAALAVTSEANIEAIRDRLGRHAGEVKFVENADWYCSPAAALRGYQEFAERRLKAGAPWVHVVGEIACDPDSESQLRQWQRYEALLNLAFGRSPMTIICPYDRRVVHPDVLSQAWLTHPHTVQDGRVRRNSAYANFGDVVLED